MSIRDFRSPAGLPLPPLPGERRHSDEGGCLAGGQACRLAGGLDGGGVGHACRHPPRHPWVQRTHTSPSMTAPAGYPAKSGKAWCVGNASGSISLPQSWQRSYATSVATVRSMAMVFMSNSILTGLRNADLCVSLYPLDIYCQGLFANYFRRAN